MDLRILTSISVDTSLKVASNTYSSIYTYAAHNTLKSLQRNCFELVLCTLQALKQSLASSSVSIATSLLRCDV